MDSPPLTVDSTADHVRPLDSTPVNIDEIAASESPQDQHAIFTDDSIRNNLDSNTDNVCDSLNPASSGLVTIGSPTEALNKLSSSTGSHPRYQHLLRQMLAEVSTAKANPNEFKLILNRLTDIYAEYLTAVDRARLPTNSDRFRSLGLHCIALRPCSQLILRTVAFVIYRNPTRHREVAANIIAEFRGDRQKWSDYIRGTEHTGLSYDDMTAQMARGGAYSVHR